MNQLVEERKLGRPARKRARACVMAFLRHGAKNGWYSMPNTGTDFAAPSTNPDSMRQAKARAGIVDNSDRVLTGPEIDKLLNRATPTFKAIILLGINTGLGPADIGRLTWDKIDLASGRLNFPRRKTGAQRRGYLWKKTRNALKQIKTLKHNCRAIERQGEAAHVFVTRTGRGYYVESERTSSFTVGNTDTTKLVGVVVDNAISRTFSRVAKDVGLSGVNFYRLRHSFRTYGQRARAIPTPWMCAWGTKLPESVEFTTTR